MITNQRGLLDEERNFSLRLFEANLFFCNHIAYLGYFIVDFPGFFRSKETYLRILLKDNQNRFLSSDVKVLCSISGCLHDALIEIASLAVRCFPVSLQAEVRR